MKAAQAGAYYFLLICTAIGVLFPLYYAFVGSIMTDQELTAFPPAVIPTSFDLGNFGRALKVLPLGRQYFNSMIVSVAIVVGVLATSVLSAYAFVFLRFPYKGLVFSTFMLTMMIPAEAIIIPKYLLVSDLQWLNTYPGLIVPFLATAFGTFLMRQSFLTFPSEIYEAAKMDGCGHLRFIWTILTPLSRNGLGTLAVYIFIGAYNQFFWPLLVTNTPDMQTLQIGLASLDSAESRSPSLVFAGVVIAVAPMLLIFFAFQRSIVRGLTSGAVK